MAKQKQDRRNGNTEFLERLVAVETKVDIIIDDMADVKKDFKVSNDDMKKFISHEITLQKENILKAEKIMDRRLEGMNEFREQMNQQEKNFVTKDTYETAHTNLVEKIGEIKTWQDKAVGGKTGVTDFKSWVTWGILVAGFIMTYFALRGGL